jgi:hypothetical protein
MSGRKQASDIGMTKRGMEIALQFYQQYQKKLPPREVKKKEP